MSSSGTSLCRARFAKATDDFELASKRADSSSAQTHLALARYYALRGLFDWAADEFDKFAATAGALRAEVSSLQYGRALWLSGRLDHALVQYRLALKNGEAGARYFKLCMAAIEREAKATAP